jgi:hypothetical protein
MPSAVFIRRILDNKILMIEPKSNPNPAWFASYLALVLCAAISIVFGSMTGLKLHTTTDFRAVYYGTRCLLQNHNPYNVNEMEHFVTEVHGVRQTESYQQRQAVTLYVNLPGTFILIAPFAILPFDVAQVLWLVLLAVLLLLGGFLIWCLGQRFAPGLSLFLTCVVLANSFVIFSGGNAAGVAVPLCVASVWCFVRERFVAIGVLCMAFSLAIKPHDSGLIWLFFLLAGGVYRKRALQSLVGTVAVVLSGMLWVSLIAPHWISDWRANMNLIASPGHINDPGPGSIVGFHNLGPVIDLQSVLSVFWDNSLFYNSMTYLICGAMLLIWAFVILKSRSLNDRVWLALAVTAPLTMLITYHRPWDAKLLLLAIPGCAIVWGQGGVTKWASFLITSATLLSVSDIPLAMGIIFARQTQAPPTGFFMQLSRTILFDRPIPLLLLVSTMFYLWIFFRSAKPMESSRDALGRSTKLMSVSVQH